ncbi:MAG: hypothetical protein U0Y96_08360 [Candidatus Kapaibacterium sp.]|nr:hypothetical protein [Bacteroidota bacterium]
MSKGLCKSFIVYSILLVILNVQQGFCKNNDLKTQAYELLKKYTTDSLNLRPLLGPNNIHIEKIKGSQLILLTAQPYIHQPHLTTIDINLKKMVSNLKTPTSDYIFTRFDVSDDSMYVVNCLHPEELFSTSLTLEGYKKRNLSSIFKSSNILPKDIIVHHNRLYTINDTHGFTSVTLDNLENSYLGIDSKRAQYINSVISLPLDNVLNLASSSNNDKILFNAVDANNKVRWIDTLEREEATISTLNPTEIHNQSNNFIVFHNGILINYNKYTGSKKWEKRLYKNVIKVRVSHTFIYKDNIIVYTLTDTSGYYPTPETEFIATVQMYDLNTAELKWSSEFNSLGNSNAGFVNKYLFVYSDKIFKVINVEDGVELGNIVYSNSQKTPVSFKTLRDMCTGKYYLLTTDEILFW